MCILSFCCVFIQNCIYLISILLAPTSSLKLKTYLQNKYNQLEMKTRCLGQTIGHENCSRCFITFSRHVCISLLLFLDPLCFGGGVNFLIDLSVVPPSPALDEPLYISWTLSHTLPIIYFIYFHKFICFDLIIYHLIIITHTFHYIAYFVLFNIL